MKYLRCSNCKVPIWADRKLSAWWPCWTKEKEKRECDAKLCTKCARDSRYCRVCRAEKALTEDPPDPGNENVAFGFKALNAMTTGQENTAIGTDALFPERKP